MSSRESERIITKGKVAAEMGLQLEKSALNIYMGMRNCCKEKDVI